MIPGSASSHLLGAPASAGAEFTRSLRFNPTDSAHLSRTPAAAGNRTTWTWAGWVKRGSPTNFEVMFGSADATPSDYDILGFNGGGFTYAARSAGSNTVDLQSVSLLRDPAAWYHIVLAFDSTQATSTDRVKVYVNGAQATLSGTYPTQNYQTTRFNTAVSHTIGRFGDYATNFAYFSGYLTGIHFIDGQALAASSFGEFDINGVWQPKRYTGTYGTNGFRLDFADNSNTTAATLGKDTSANANNFTPNNLSLTGTANASVTDSPSGTAGQSDSGAGGTVTSNYVTLNPLASTVTLAGGNLRATNLGLGWQNSNSTITVPTSGLWYAEATVVLATGSSSAPSFGLSSLSTPITDTNQGTGSWNIIGTSTTLITRNGTQSQISASGIAANTVLRLAVDLANSRAWMGIGTSWYDGTTGTTGDPSTGANPTFTSLPSQLFIRAGVFANTLDVNFGQRPFAYNAPTGYKALCTANLPAPAIARGANVMDTVLYTGTGVARTISGLSFSPDLVWNKERSATGTDPGHRLLDSVRGSNLNLATHLTSSEYDPTALTQGGLGAVTADGFTIVAGTTGTNNANNLSSTYAAWCWDAGSNNATNTSGTITSTVRANTTAGFSVLTYTGNGTAGATIGHGLGVAPQMIMIKQRNGVSNWLVYTTAIDGSLDFFGMSNAAKSDSALSVPTSTVFSVSAGGDVNVNAATYVGYAWAPVAGFSAFGVYTGNGSANGPFVHTGFRPALVLVKMSSSTGDWTILDDKRLGYNVDNNALFPNLSNAEGTTDLIDITSNGFKVRTTDAAFNNATVTYFYAAWASVPFAYARAR